jgi:uncharacterized protein
MGVKQMVFDCHMHLTEPVELIIQEMNRNGVDKGIVCPSGVARGEEVISLATAKAMMESIADSRSDDPGLGAARVGEWNRKNASLLAPFSDRLRGFAKVDLRLPEKEIAASMEEALKLGLIGFGEILGVEVWPDSFGCVLAVSAEMGGYPLFVHGDYPVTPEVLALIADWAGRYPAVPLILGHIGGDFWIDAIEHARDVENIYLDISEAVNLVALRTAAVEVPEKLLYGSDFPWETMGVGLLRLKSLDLPVELEKGILGGNLEKLLGSQLQQERSSRNA